MNLQRSPLLSSFHADLHEEWLPLFGITMGFFCFRGKLYAMLG